MNTTTMLRILKAFLAMSPKVSSVAVSWTCDSVMISFSSVVEVEDVSFIDLAPVVHAGKKLKRAFKLTRYLFHFLVD